MNGADLTLGASEFIERSSLQPTVLPPDCGLVSQDCSSLARQENQFIGGIFFWPVS